MLQQIWGLSMICASCQKKTTALFVGVALGDLCGACWKWYHETDDKDIHLSKPTLLENNWVEMVYYDGGTVFPESMVLNMAEVKSSLIILEEW